MANVVVTEISPEYMIFQPSGHRRLLRIMSGMEVHISIHERLSPLILNMTLIYFHSCQWSKNGISNDRLIF